MLQLFEAFLFGISLALVALHAYRKTKGIVGRDKSYWIFFTGTIILTLAFTIASIQGCRHVWIYYIGVMTSLFGVGSIVRALKIRTTRDYLTGLITRTSFFDEYLPREIKRARRSGKPISVILIDVDDFKAINDVYGHKKGDEVLKKVASVIRSSVRGSDAVVRFGGDEILVVLPEADEEGAKAVLRRIRKNLRKSSKDFPLTISAGIGVWDGSESFDDVIERADRMMYEEKRRKGKLIPSSRR